LAGVLCVPVPPATAVVLPEDAMIADIRWREMFLNEMFKILECELEENMDMMRG
jgi:hypothetical protein